MRKWTATFKTGSFIFGKQEYKESREVEWFDNLPDTLQYLIEQQEYYLQELRKELEIALETHADLIRILNETKKG